MVHAHRRRAAGLPGDGRRGLRKWLSGSHRVVPTGAGRKDLTLNFGDYESHAQLTYPTTAGRHPAVVLIPGSAPEDRNADICFPPGHVLSHNFADIAKYLTRRGYAVLRYDKRGVTGPCRRATTVPLSRLLSDAGTVLAAAKKDPHVDPRHVFARRGRTRRGSPCRTRAPRPPARAR